MVVPIAGLILTAVVSYELLHMVVEHKHTQGLESWQIAKWLFKTCVAVWLLNHSFYISLAFFDLANYIVNRSMSVIGIGNPNASALLANIAPRLAALAFQGFFILLCVGMYAALVRGVFSAGDLHAAVLTCAGYSLLLGFSIAKTGSFSKGIFS